MLLSMNLFSIGPLQADEKTGLVLLPIQGPKLDEYDKQSYRTALQEALSAQYTVYSERDMDKKITKISEKICIFRGMSETGSGCFSGRAGRARRGDKTR